MTTLQNVKDQITKMLEAKAQELAFIDSKYKEALSQATAAEVAIKAATEKTDLQAYEKALSEKAKADNAVQMYAARLRQIQKKELISESESDAVLASLDEYERGLTTKFEADIAVHYQTLRKILDDYRNDIEDVENTITRWTDQVHANYRSQTTTYQNGTNRSDKPIPFHAVKYIGCPESVSLAAFLEDK